MTITFDLVVSDQSNNWY